MFNRYFVSLRYTFGVNNTLTFYIFFSFSFCFSCNNDIDNSWYRYYISCNNKAKTKRKKFTKKTQHQQHVTKQHATSEYSLNNYCARLRIWTTKNVHTSCWYCFFLFNCNYSRCKFHKKISSGCSNWYNCGLSSSLTPREQRQDCLGKNHKKHTIKYFILIANNAIFMF